MRRCSGAFTRAPKPDILYGRARVQRDRFTGGRQTRSEPVTISSKLNELDAAPFLGDYTQKDPEITAELLRWDKSGGPLRLCRKGQSQKARPFGGAGTFPNHSTGRTLLRLLLLFD